MKKATKQRLLIIVFLIFCAGLTVSCAGLQLSQLIERIVPSFVSEQKTTLKSGTLALDEISVDFRDVDIPKGSDLSLEDVSDTVQVDGLISRIYRLDIDFMCNQPITISMDLGNSIPMQGEDGEVLMVGIGLATPNSGAILNRFIEPIISDGILTAKIVPGEILGSNFIRGVSPSASVEKPVKEHLYIGTYWNSSINDENNHFKVWFPGSLQVREHFFFSKSDREALLADLEAVYQNFLAKGYTYKERTKWPIDIYVQSLDAEGYYSEGKAGTVGGEVYYETINSGCLYLNSNLFINGYQRQKVKPILAHEFFHFVQRNYSTPKTSLNWLDEATATYFEWEVNRGDWPATSKKYWNLIYDGIYPEEDSASQGYARLPLIGYLAETNSENFILKTYQLGGANDDWINAIHVSIQKKEHDWVTDFYHRYFLGETISYYRPNTFYNELIKGNQQEFIHAGQVLALAVPDQEEIHSALENDDVAILGNITLTIPALGARVVALDVDTESLKNLPDAMDPVLHVEGNVDLSVYEMKGSQIVKLGGVGDIKLNDFKANVTDKVKYMALVVGLHETGRENVEFSVELPPGVPIESIRLIEEDIDGQIQSGYSAALAALGDIPVDSEGNFTATLDYAKAQYDDLSSQCGYEDTVTWNIEVTNFVIDGAWDPINQTGKGTISCHIKYEFEEICDGTFGETTIVNLLEVDSTAVFEMEIKDNYLDVKIDTEGTALGTNTWYSKNGSPLVSNLQWPAGPRVDVKLSYTTP